MKRLKELTLTLQGLQQGTRGQAEPYAHCLPVFIMPMQKHGYLEKVDYQNSLLRSK